jgi:Secretion system C-terminal sorting domain
MLWCATNQGIFKTINGGTTWIRTQTGNFSNGALRLKPNDPSVIYISSFNGIYKSTNFGDSFTKLITGLPSFFGRSLVDVSAADPQVVYALLGGNDNLLNLYKSVDSGATFTFKGVTNVDENQQTWYNMALAVSPTNADEVYTGTINIWKSTNGGTLLEKLNSWSAPFSANYTHADIHQLKFYGDRLVCGSDGGIYISDNQGANFTDLTTSAQIGQFYKVAVSKQSAGKMVGGLQDNGGFGYSNAAWKNFYGADGMDTAVDPTNSNLFYGFIQSGSRLYISYNGANSIGTSVAGPANENGNWVTPLAVNSVGEIFAGYNFLYKLNGTSWDTQSDSSVGSVNIDQLTIDPRNDDFIWVAVDKKLYKSIDKGIHFTNPYTAVNEISSICVNSYNSNIIYLVTNGTNGQVLKSTDGGLTFTSISFGLPAVGKNCIVHQGRNTNNPLYLGTQLGVYYLDDTLTGWVPFDTNLPNIQVTDLEINLEDSKIIAATYGRGIWQSDISRQTPQTDLKLIEIIQPTNLINCNAITPIINVKNNGLSTINSINVSYTINAVPHTFNWTGVLNSLQSTNITLTPIVANSGNYTLKIIATTPNDAFPDNNNMQVPFNFNNSGAIGVVNTFETPATELITYGEGSSDSWFRGIRSGSTLDTGTNNVYATNLTGNYSDNKKAYLVSQCYDLTSISNPEIRFKMAFDVEQNYDYFYVQYSINNGASWTVLGSMGANWYNNNRTSTNPGGDCYFCPGAQWTGTDTSVKEYFYPLNALGSNNNIIFRFVFQSDDSYNGLGVIVDDFVVNGTLATEDFDIKKTIIYPNPTTGIFNIGVGNSKLKTLEVTDISGKIIFNQNEFDNSSNDIQINLSNVAKGVYFVKISTDEATTVKKIIKN